MDEQIASEWRADIEEKLKDTTSCDLLISYANVAEAFPSDRPHPERFEHKCIDDDSLKAWAKERGWAVTTAPESAADSNTLSPPIRFMKL